MPPRKKYVAFKKTKGQPDRESVDPRRKNSKKLLLKKKEFSDLNELEVLDLKLKIERRIRKKKK